VPDLQGRVRRQGAQTPVLRRRRRSHRAGIAARARRLRFILGSSRKACSHGHR
jgi:hypothetical protein